MTLSKSILKPITVGACVVLLPGVLVLQSEITTHGTITKKTMLTAAGVMLSALIGYISQAISHYLAANDTTNTDAPTTPSPPPFKAVFLPGAATTGEGYKDTPRVPVLPAPTVRGPMGIVGIQPLEP